MKTSVFEGHARAHDLSRVLTIGCFAFMVVCLVETSAHANEVELPAAADTTIYEDDAGAANGSGVHLFAGANANGDARRALLQFDVGRAIPAGSSIEAVELTLEVSRTRADATNIAVHRLTTDWREGTSDAVANEGQGAPAADGEATWSHSAWSTQTWSAPGGDYDPTSSARAPTRTDPGPQTWSDTGLIADVQTWIDSPDQNFGWILIGDESSEGTTLRFHSRNTALSALRPTLRVTFTPSVSAGACCYQDGICGEVADPAATCPDYEGVDTTCSAVACPQPLGACCQPNAAASCVEVTEAACLGQLGAFAGGNTSCADQRCPVVLTPFLDPLPIPAVAVPITGDPGATATYRMEMVELQQQLHLHLPPTTVWGFSDGISASFPGPTIEARSGMPVSVTWANGLRAPDGQLRDRHPLPVDTCLHGVRDAVPRTVVHLHGGHVPAAFDGHPEETINPGEEVVYEYPNAQQAAPLWYHDHALGITRLNVYMGLAGLYVIRDDVEDALSLPSRRNEIPLVIQDRTFLPDGSLLYPSKWQQHFFGDTILVNGKVWPFLNVDRGKYRFRVLNGSGSRTYTLSLSPSGSIDVVGTDGGLLPQPVRVPSVTIMPGERYDIVVDFSNSQPGATIDLVNSAAAPYPGPRGEGAVRDVLRFIVGSQVGHTEPLPQTLRDVAEFSPDDAVASRDFVLDQVADACTGSKWLINGLGWDDITERPRLGTTEIWRFINNTGISHPMHMHLVFFQVLDRQRFDFVDGEFVPNGDPIAPAPTQEGWHDTIEVGPREMVRVIARFDDYTGRFAYHCHILEHEDHEMMRQFEAFTECGDGALGQPDEVCDDGNLVDGDGCDSNCTATACGNGVATAGEECDDANTTPGDGCEPDCIVTPVPADDAGHTDVGPTRAELDWTVRGGGCAVAVHGSPPWSFLLFALAAARSRHRRRVRRAA